jgi:hypothetical protein
MDKSMEEQVIELARKHLPEYVGKELREVISDRERLKAKVENQEIAINSFRSSQERLVEANESMQAQLSAHRDMDAKTSLLEERERNLEVALLKQKLECAAETNQKLFELVGLIFKSPIIKSEIHGNIPVSPGNGAYPVSAPFYQASVSKQADA